MTMRTFNNCLCLRARDRSSTIGCVVCVVLFVLPTYKVEGAEERHDVLDIVTGGGIVHDSNLFKLPSSAGAQAALGKGTKADTLTTAYVGLRVNKPYAQQLFQVDVTETIYRYQTFSHLNFEAFDYRGAWQWHVTPRFRGTLSAERTKTLVPFEDYRLLSQQRNVRDNRNQTFLVDWWAFGGWHVLAGLANVEQKSELPLLADADFSLVDRQAGVRYESKAGNSIALAQHSRRGDYGNRAIDPVTFNDSGFSENETDLRWRWQISGHSTFDGRFGRTSRNHDSFPQRDYSGLVGDLGYGWTPTGKVKVYFTAKRNIDAVIDPFASYRVRNSIAVSPAWHATEKIILSLRLEQVDSDFRGPVVAPVGPMRSETLRSMRLMADWKPTRNIALSAGFQRSERSSNLPDSDFDASIVYVRGGFRF